MSVKQNQDTTESGWRKKKKQLNKASEVKSPGCQVPRTLDFGDSKNKTCEKKKKNRVIHPSLLEGPWKKFLGKW